MNNEQNAQNTVDENQNESGQPGGGRGRRDEIGETGVYPVSASEGASLDAKIQPGASFGQGERGAEGYEDSGSSEISYLSESTGPVGGAGMAPGESEDTSQ